MSDPREIPSQEEVEESGTAGWMEKLVENQKSRNRNLAALLGDSSEELSRRRQALAGLFGDPGPDAPAAGDDEPPPPDLFAEERERRQRSRRALAGLFDEERRAREEERRRLGGFFQKERPRRPRR